MSLKITRIDFNITDTPNNTQFSFSPDTGFVRNHAALDLTPDDLQTLADASKAMAVKVKELEAK